MDVPDHLSLEHLRGKGLQPGEQAQPEVRLLLFAASLANVGCAHTAHCSVLVRHRIAAQAEGHSYSDMCSGKPRLSCRSQQSRPPMQPRRRRPSRSRSSLMQPL